MNESHRMYVQLSLYNQGYFWFTASVGDGQLPFLEKDLRHWRLIDDFRKALETSIDPKELHPSFKDPRRQHSYASYLSLFLFGLFNPAVRTLRGLSIASQFKRVQEDICDRPISLATLSEMQHLLEPSKLEAVYSDLSKAITDRSPRTEQAGFEKWLARDSSVFAALPRMTWALYGGGHEGCPNRAVRLQLSFNVLNDTPDQADVTLGRICERKSWEAQLEKGAAYVGDRYYSKNYSLLDRIVDQECSFVLRLAEEATIEVEENLPVSEEDREHGVDRQAWCRLGKGGNQTRRVRVVWIEGAQSALMLVTNLGPEKLSGAMVSMLYRRRWQIECYFKWLKCLLKCRHWLAESQRGVTIQIYLSLIASVLLQLCLGRRPNKRVMEALQLYQLGYVTSQELRQTIKNEEAKEARKKRA